MYSNVMANIKNNNKFPVCCNQSKLNYNKYKQLCEQSQEKAELCDKIRNDFGEEYTSDAKREWRKIAKDRDTVCTCLKLNKVMDSLMQEIIDEYSLEFIGNGSKECDGSQGLVHLWNHDNASCFKAKAKDAYILMEHSENIFNGYYFIDFDIHYVFSNSVECALLEWDLRKHDDYFNFSDEPNRIGFVDLHYDVYEKAEYFYMQKKLKEKLEQFFEQHRLDIILWEELENDESGK